MVSPTNIRCVCCSWAVLPYGNSSEVPRFLPALSKGVNSVPYQTVWAEYTVLASKPVRITPLFRTGKNTGRIGHVPAGPANFGQYQHIQIFFFFFLSFLIFEFLLGQNDNLFALTYQYYLFSQYAMVTFKLSIFYIVFFFFSFN